MAQRFTTSRVIVGLVILLAIFGTASTIYGLVVDHELSPYDHVEAEPGPPAELDCRAVVVGANVTPARHRRVRFDAVVFLAALDERYPGRVMLSVSCEAGSDFVAALVGLNPGAPPVSTFATGVPVRIEGTIAGISSRRERPSHAYSVVITDAVSLPIPVPPPPPPPTTHRCAMPSGSVATLPLGDHCESYGGVEAP